MKFPKLFTKATSSAGGRKRKAVLALLLLSALVAFDMFNFGSTRFVLDEFFGGSSTFGVGWSGMLAFAFAVVDFAGLARVFTPTTKGEPMEVKLLFGGWLLAAGFNAFLTWFAVADGVSKNPNIGNELITREAIVEGIPVAVALMVLLTRVLLIGATSLSLDNVLHGKENTKQRARQAPNVHRPSTGAVSPRAQVLRNGGRTFDVENETFF